MPTSTIRFSKTTLHDTELGKIEIPNKKIAVWINFLTAPKQQAQIISADQQRNGLILYFQAPDNLYTYLDHRINGEHADEPPSKASRRANHPEPHPVAS
ncbi:MAG: hypothetical protein IGR76_01095 [Synechococcales cyanobacterium T60_A2020_003]|nr:hypothetical protein [Synechococcales cyanobacterium T60_A2020_003]